MSRQKYEDAMLKYAVNVQTHVLRLGKRSQFGRHLLAKLGVWSL